MKKQWLVMGLVATFGLVANSFADVQNIRLSGDIRIRGYFLADAAEGNNSLQDQSAFIAQRTRVSVEADLEDHVLVVVTLKAEGLWGANNETSSSAGAGLEDDAGEKLNRSWDLGVTEAYVQLNELFYSPATLKLGRQYLNYGHGLILSSFDQEYNYDAARLVLDYYPLTIDLVGARLADFGSFGGDSHTVAGSGTANLLFANLRYEMTDSVLKDIEAYFGWIGQSAHNGASTTRIPPGLGGASPWVIGVRGDLTPADAVKIWFEGTYEGGSDGTVANETISAWLVNAGASFSMKDSSWSPSMHVNYTYASGGGHNGRTTFRPWFDYVDGYNGYLFAPLLSNLHIFNVGASVKPYENTTLSLQAYYYLKDDKDGFAGSNANIDFGGLEFANGEIGTVNSRELGWEIDTILGYDYSKDVRMQLVYGMFIPGAAFNHDSAVNSVAHEVRGEINVRF